MPFLSRIPTIQVDRSRGPLAAILGLSRLVPDHTYEGVELVARLKQIQGLAQEIESVEKTERVS
jgi:hypothetical protein